MTKKNMEPEGTIVYTDEQLKGKGQRGNIWIAEPGKNVLMSILLRPKFLTPSHQFYLNLIAGLAIVDTLREYLDGEILLKWPNDVYVNGKKVSGVLIENNLRGSTFESAVVGVGINVNQKGFRINTATSLVLETGKEFERELLIEKLVCHLEKWYLNLKKGAMLAILSEYHNLLMWRGEMRRFSSHGEELEGEIIGIDKTGNLAININGSLRTFGIKEVEFIR